MTIDPDQAMRIRRTVNLWGTLGVTWAVLQIPFSFIIAPVLIVNGWVFAAYAAVFYSIRHGRGDGIRATIVAVVGATHLIWMFWILYLVGTFPFSPLLQSWSWQCLTTGVVLGGVTFLLSLRWWTLIPLIAGTLLSVLVSELFRGGFTGPFSFGGPITLLHLGLLGALIPDTLSRLPKPRPPWICPACGYDCRGIAGTLCPECGAALAPSPAAAAT